MIPDRTDRPRQHQRTPTYPLAHAARRKPRRLPLVFRFIKGAIHAEVLLPVICHSLFTVLIVFLDRHVNDLGLPSTIVPSLSIVVGLMLVFRNSTSYDRFWTGRNALSEAGACVKNIVRGILVHVRDGRVIGERTVKLTEKEMAETEEVVRVLIGSLVAIKYSLRQEWIAGQRKHERVEASDALRTWFLDGVNPAEEQALALNMRYGSLLPKGFTTLEHLGLSLPLQLMVHVEAYVSHYSAQGYFHAPGSAWLSNQIGSFTTLYSKLETIRSTPLPIAYLIHQKQVLALYLLFLPFTIVDNYEWYSIGLVALVAFTLYGIEGIGSQLEDPFGYDRNDIKMDGIVEDWKVECTCLLEEWKNGDRGLFSTGLPKAINELGI